MIVLLDTSEALDVCAAELGCGVKQLITPLTGFIRQKEHDKFAIDNGFFSKIDPDGFLRILRREREASHLCRFVAVPDIVGSAKFTIDLFHHWKYKMTGWPLALVAQDGLEDPRLAIPWKQFDALFIGGTTGWKLGEFAKQAIHTARAMGKYVHVGRVNTPGRFEYFEKLGVDSIDGTGLSRYTHMREKIWAAYNQPSLLTAPVLTADESLRPKEQRSSIAEIADVITAANGNDEKGFACTEQ